MKKLLGIMVLGLLW